MTSLSEFFKRQFYSRKTTIVSILIIAAVGLISISWFQGNFLIDGLDRSFPPGRITFFLRGFSMWDIFQLGGASPRNLAGLFPTNLYYAFSDVAGLSLVGAEQLWFYFLFTSAGLSMYFLTSTAFRGKYWQLVGVVSALFYMFNPYTMIAVVPQMWLYIIFLPLILGMFIKGIQERRGLKYIILMSLIWTLTTTSDYANPKYLLFDLTPIFLYLALHILFNRNMAGAKRSLRFTGLLLAVWGALNAFWIIPTALSLKNIISLPLSSYAAIGTSRLSSYALGSAPLSGAFRLLGFWSLNSGYKGFPYVYWAPAYNTTLFIAIGFLIPVVSFAFLLRRSKNQKRYFFVILALIGLFMMNGSLPPLGWINDYIVTHVPFAVDIFSNPYLFGGMYVALSFAFLFGMFISDLLSSRRLIVKVPNFRRGQFFKYVLAGLILFLVIGLYAFPLWNGDVIYPGNVVMASNRYSIPSYYYDAKAWLSADSSEFRIFPMPYSILGYGAYNWPPEGFNGPDPTESLLGRPLVAGQSGEGLGLVTAQYLANGSDYNVAKLLAMMNVKYLLVHNDADSAFLSGNNWYVSATSAQIRSILNNQTGFSYAKSFGELDFYKNNYWQPMKIYSASTSVLSDGNLDQLTQLVDRNDFAYNTSVIMLSNQLNAQQISNIPMNTVLVQNPDLNLTYDPVSGVQIEDRLVYMLKSLPVVSARYYSSWKGVVSTNGTGDPGMIVFSSPSQCPYLSAFPMNFENWSSYDSVLIYIISPSPLTINSIIADGAPVTGSAWWQTGTSWITGWPITIPSNQNAVVQVSQQASNITLETDKGPLSISVTDGWKNPLNNENPFEKPTTIFTPVADDFLLVIKPTSGYDYGNLSVRIDNQSFNVNLNLQEQSSVYSNKYIGPIYLTAGSHTIRTTERNATGPIVDSMLLCSLKKGESFLNTDNLLSSNQQSSASVNYEEINPTKYTVHVNSSQPFYLIFSDSYDNGWIATVNGQQIPNQYHFVANGYANGWYLNKTGTYTVTLEFTPQNLFYAGVAISIISLIICSLYVSNNKITNIYRKNLKKNKVSK